MFFLLRLLFWFSIVLFFLPLGGKNSTGENQVDALEAVSAAKTAVEDIASMCARNPDVCVTGKAALQMAGERVRNNARIALDTLDNQLESRSTQVDAPRPDAPVIPIPTARPK